jgi:mRNA-degrading endonuclease toxin of MazEF toxin-antitoxin module
MKKFINSYRAQNTRNDYYEPTTNSNPPLDNSKRLDIVFLKRGTVYWYEETLTKEISDYLRMCGYTTGSRPVIVYQNIDIPRTGVTIIPLTRSETVKNGVPVDIERGSTSIALVPEIRCVPIKSLVKYIGVINEDKMQEIDKAVRTFHGSIDDVDTDYFPRRWTYMNCGIDMGHAADNGLSERVVVCHIVAVGFSYLCGCNSNHTDYGTEH